MAVGVWELKPTQAIFELLAMGDKHWSHAVT